MPIAVAERSRATVGGPASATGEQPRELLRRCSSTTLCPRNVGGSGIRPPSSGNAGNTSQSSLPATATSPESAPAVVRGKSLLKPLLWTQALSQGHPGTVTVRLNRGRRMAWKEGCTGNPRADVAVFSFDDLRGIVRAAVASPYVQLGQGTASYKGLAIG
eukprot:6788250-Alexandrium_andersonii.AAC.1